MVSNIKALNVKAQDKKRNQQTFGAAMKPTITTDPPKPDDVNLVPSAIIQPAQYEVATGIPAVNRQGKSSRSMIDVQNRQAIPQLQSYEVLWCRRPIVQK